MTFYAPLDVTNGEPYSDQPALYDVDNIADRLLIGLHAKTNTVINAPIY